MRWVIALPTIFLTSALFSSCSASSGAGLLCHLVPHAICIPSVNFYFARGTHVSQAVDGKVILNGENVALMSGTYKAKATARGTRGKVLGTRSVDYSLKDNVARFVHPAALEKWLRGYLRKNNVALQITSDEVPIIVTDPTAKSGTITEIMMYKNIPVASSVGHIVPVKGCWYNETLCSGERSRPR